MTNKLIDEAIKRFEELSHAYYEPGDKTYWDAIEYGESCLKQELQTAISKTREETKLETARKIASAAGEAGLSPIELTDPKCWKKEVEKTVSTKRI